jgi:hypothetical protein
MSVSTDIVFGYKMEIFTPYVHIELKFEPHHAMFALRRQSFICQLCSHSRRFYANSAKTPVSSKKADVAAALKPRKSKKVAAVVDEVNIYFV